jgi:hypothetical protein
MMPSITRNVPFPAELLERLGRTMEEFRADWEYLAAHRDELTARFPEKWVAVFDKKVVASSRTLEELLPKLEKKGLKGSTSAIDFLSSKPVTLRLSDSGFRQRWKALYRRYAPHSTVEPRDQDRLSGRYRL